MNWQEYRAEIVTHCICAGADQKKAEIRIPSIRGEIRWWFRALGGSPQEEKDLFGGVHNEAKKSSVVFRLGDSSCRQVTYNLPDLFGSIPNDSRAYLLWPLRPMKQQDQKRGMILPGSTFTLRCAIRNSLLKEELICKMHASIRLWLLLGSMGTRGRRGFGSLILCSEALRRDASLNSLRQMLRENLVVYGHPKIKIMILGNSYDTASDTLGFLGDWLKKWRAGSKKSGVNPSQWGRNDHDAVMSKRGVLYRPAIGLPITQRYQSTGIQIDTTPQNSNRWASPVHMKVMKLGERYYPMAVFFSEMALPEGYKVKVLQKRDRSQVDFAADHSLFRAMMEPKSGADVLWEPE